MKHRFAAKKFEILSNRKDTAVRCLHCSAVAVGTCRGIVFRFLVSCDNFVGLDVTDVLYRTADVCAALRKVRNCNRYLRA